MPRLHVQRVHEHARDDRARFAILRRHSFGIPVSRSFTPAIGNMLAHGLFGVDLVVTLLFTVEAIAKMASKGVLSVRFLENFLLRK